MLKNELYLKIDASLGKGKIPSPTNQENAALLYFY